MTRLGTLRFAYQLLTWAAGVAHFCRMMLAAMRLDDRIARELSNLERAERGGVGVA